MSEKDSIQPQDIKKMLNEYIERRVTLLDDELKKQAQVVQSEVSNALEQHENKLKVIRDSATQKKKGGFLARFKSKGKKK
jgi:predicted nucleotidyltransferase